jgi:ubiquinone/menaquinone biosynthesis C-methylase UbiE
VAFKDHFSKHAADYARFRPRYPHKMFEYLGTVAPSKKLAWDCATGNGQAAVFLADVFARVIATDGSEKQIANAEKHDRVEYRVALAEESEIGSECVDLLMVAQALHWLDHARFYREVRRVLKTSGIFAASAYKFFHITSPIDEILNGRYYKTVVGPCWPPERVLVEKFDEVPFPFAEIKTPRFEMTAKWNLEHLVGYLRSWSASQRFIAEKKRDPIDEIAAELWAAWGDPDQPRKIVWPLTLRVGVKEN